MEPRREEQQIDSVNADGEHSVIPVGWSVCAAALMVALSILPSDQGGFSQ